MSIDWLQIVLNFVISLITIAGGGSLLYVGVTRKMKSVEVSDKQVDVELKEAEAWKKLYEEQKAISNGKSQRLKECYYTIDKQKAHEARLMQVIQQLKWYRCICSDCQNRKPPRDYTADVEKLEADLLSLATKQSKQ